MRATLILIYLLCGSLYGATNLVKKISPTLDARHMTRGELFGCVDNAWKIDAHVQEESKVSVAAVVDMREALNVVTLPELQFAKMPLARVVPLLNTLIQKSAPKICVHCIFVRGEGEGPIVNVDLKNVSLWRALELIAMSVNYTLDVDQDAVVFRDHQNAQHQPLETKFFPLARGTAVRMLGLKADGHVQFVNQKDQEEEIKQFLQRAGVDFNLEGASIAFDGTQLIVTQTGHNLCKVRNILERYAETKQVSIEAKFIEVEQGVLEELGINWNAQGKHAHTILQTGTSSRSTDTQYSNLRSLNSVFGRSASTDNTGSISTTYNTAADTQSISTTSLSTNVPHLPTDINVGAATIATGDFLGVLHGFSLNAVIQALEQHAGSDLMSAPKLTVLSGKTANIVVAQEFRYPKRYGDIRSDVGMSGSNTSSGAAGVTITAGTPLEFETRNIGVEMEVTPIVEANNSISLCLKPCVTEFDGFIEYGGTSVAIASSTTVRLPSGFLQPIFSTRKIRTEVNIYNGATVVMGGLTREEVKEVHDKVPFLGDIPILGKLFQSKGETAQKKNLLIFVTADVVNSSGQVVR